MYDAVDQQFTHDSTRCWVIVALTKLVAQVYKYTYICTCVCRRRRPGIHTRLHALLGHRRPNQARRAGIRIHIYMYVYIHTYICVYMYDAVDRIFTHDSTRCWVIVALTKLVAQVYVFIYICTSIYIHIYLYICMTPSTSNSHTTPRAAGSSSP